MVREWQENYTFGSWKNNKGFDLVWVVRCSFCLSWFMYLYIWVLVSLGETFPCNDVTPHQAAWLQSQPSNWLHYGPGTQFTKGLWAHCTNLGKILAVLMWKIVHPTGILFHLFYHKTPLVLVKALWILGIRTLLNIKMLSCQYKSSHYKDYIISWLPCIILIPKK